MESHVYFYTDIWKIIPKFFLLPLIIWSCDIYYRGLNKMDFLLTIWAISNKYEPKCVIIPPLNSPVDMVQMRGHNICFQ